MGSEKHNRKIPTPKSPDFSKAPLGGGYSVSGDSISRREPKQHRDIPFRNLSK